MTEIEYQLVKFEKIEVGLVKLDVFRNYWTVQFREISSRVKSPNFGYRAYRAHCVIKHVGVQLGCFVVLKIILRPSEYPNVVGSVIGA